VRALGRALLLKARVSAACGEDAVARSCFEHAIDMLEVHGYHGDLARAWLAFARFLDALACEREAADALRTARALLIQYGTRREIADAQHAAASDEPSRDAPFSALVALVRALSASAGGGGIETLAARLAAKLLGADRALFVRLASSEPTIAAAFNVEDVPSDAASRIARALDEHEVAALGLSEAVPSGVCARLVVGDVCVGALHCDRAYSEGALGTFEAELLAGYAASIAGFFERAPAPPVAFYPARAARPASGPWDEIVTRSPSLTGAIELARATASSDATVLLTGESGTGKELFAQAIHRASARPGPFIAINCAALPRDLLESELFGYEDGAFTGARRAGLRGKFELASGGTLLLDEIGELPLEMQAKLLRVLDHRRIYRVGGQREISLDVRVIAATNRDLRQAMSDGLFRADLYFRLRVVHLALPPLRERREDVALLARHVLERCSARKGKRLRELSAGVLDALEAHSWPGNVRELAHLLELEVELADPTWRCSRACRVCSRRARPRARRPRFRRRKARDRSRTASGRCSSSRSPRIGGTSSEPRARSACRAPPCTSGYDASGSTQTTIVDRLTGPSRSTTPAGP
jgi:hypothetical protein